MENQIQNQPISQPSQGVPSASSGKKKKIFLIFLLLLVVVALIAGAWFVFSKPPEDATSQETNNSLKVAGENTVKSTSTPTPTIKPIEKDKVKILVLNGTGTAGHASEVGDALEALGYKEIELDNAEDQDSTTTTIEISSTLSEETINEIVASMEKIFKDVKLEKVSSASYDVKITTGVKKGQTETKKVSATPSPKPSGTTSVTVTTTTTPTPTGTN